MIFLFAAFSAATFIYYRRISNGPWISRFHLQAGGRVVSWELFPSCLCSSTSWSSHPAQELVPIPKIPQVAVINWFRHSPGTLIHCKDIFLDENLKLIHPSEYWGLESKRKWLKFQKKCENMHHGDFTRHLINSSAPSLHESLRWEIKCSRLSASIWQLGGLYH